jgi:hypothetical protein
MYVSVGVMKDCKLKLRKLHASHTLGWSSKPQVEPPGTVPVSGPGRPGVPTGYRTTPGVF